MAQIRMAPEVGRAGSGLELRARAEQKFWTLMNADGADKHGASPEVGRTVSVPGLRARAEWYTSPV